MATHKVVWLWLMVVMILGSILVLLGTLHCKHARPRLFRLYILDPIPPSVADIRVDHARKLFGYGYTFRFKIAKTDVAAIVGSRPFRRVRNAKYENRGALDFEWSPTSSEELAVYPSGQGKPAWFRPDSWQDPEAYAYQERAEQETTCLLLYNEQVGEAYFLAFKGDYTP
jgi:hypothetical protein